MHLHVQMTLAACVRFGQDVAIRAITDQCFPSQQTTLETLMIAPTAQLMPPAAAATRTRWSWLQAAAEMAALYSGGWPDADSPLHAGWPRYARVATRSPEPVASSIAAARTFTFRVLRRWEVDDYADDVTAVVSELLANALRHALPRAGAAAVGAAPRPIRLGLLDPGWCLLCAVADPNPLAPVRRQPDWLEESGRGLQVVTSLSDQWGFCVAPDLQGKVVWATFATRHGPR
jgi:anti-sigma regulatory factor (Ser/Thr protein kinase)